MTPPQSKKIVDFAGQSKIRRAPRRALLPRRNDTYEVREGPFRNFEMEISQLLCYEIYYTILYYTILYCTILYFTVLYNVILCYLTVSVNTNYWLLNSTEKEDDFLLIRFSIYRIFQVSKDIMNSSQSYLLGNLFSSPCMLN